MDRAFGQRLREARETRGMRPEEVAYRAEVSLRTVMSLEQNGTRGNLTSVVRIAAVLHVSLNWLVWGMEPIWLDHAPPASVPEAP